MKHLKVFLILMGLTIPCYSGVDGVGYDVNLQHVKMRASFNGLLLDAGLGMDFDNARADDFKSAFGVHGLLLVPMIQYERLSANVGGGLRVNKLPQKDDNVVVSVFGGFQPELVLFEKLLVSLRLGVDFILAPDLALKSFGDGAADLSSGLSFILLF